MRANVYIASRRSEEGSRLLWRNVPVETAQRLCSLDETCWAQSMLVWAYCDSLGLHPGDPVVDNGSLGHLLTEEERQEVLCWDGRGWVPVADRRGG